MTKIRLFAVCRGLYYPVIFRISSLTNQDSMESIRVFFFSGSSGFLFGSFSPKNFWRQIFSTFHGPKNGWEFQNLFLGPFLQFQSIGNLIFAPVFCLPWSTGMMVFFCAFCQLVFSHTSSKFHFHSHVA